MFQRPRSSAALSALLLISLPSLASAALVHAYDAATDFAGNTLWSDAQGSVDLSFTGSAGNVFASPVDVSSSSGYFTSAYAFGTSPIGGYAAFGWESLVASAASSYEMWIRPTTIPTGKRQVLLENGGAFSGLCLSLDTDGSILAIMKDTSHNTPPNIILDSSDQTAQLTSGEFVQVTLTFARVDTGSGIESIAKLYINGVENTTASYGGSLVFDMHDQGGIAHNSYNQLGGGQRDNDPARAYSPDKFSDYQGQIALVRLYDTALTSGEVASAYNAIVPEPATSLVLIGVGAALILSPRDRRLLRYGS